MKHIGERLRAIWLKDGDRNSSFFHKKASDWKRRNLIKGLRDCNGIWESSKEGLERVVLDYFQQIFKEGSQDSIA